MGNGTYTIPEYYLEELKNEISRLARRASRLGVPVPELVIGEGRRVRARFRNGEEYFKTVHDVTVTTTPIKLEGWLFLGTIEHLEAGNILRAAPGQTIPPTYRESGPSCEHCNVNRYRKDTYIVASEDGELLQVGSKCLKDFTFGHDPEKLASYLEALDSLEKELADGPEEGSEFGGGGQYLGYYAPGFLTYVAGSIRLYGWTSKKQEHDSYGDKQATANSAQIWYNQKRKTEYPTDEDEAEAKAALQWANELEPGANEFLWNIYVLAAEEDWSHKQLGLGAAIVFAYQRHLGDIAEAKAKNDGRESQHIGQPKEKRVFENLTLIDKRVTDNQYTGGTVTFFTFVDCDGNKIEWKTDSRSLDIGTVYEGKATIKGHTEFRGVKYTQIIRFAATEKDGE